jgi:hypothetical protein
VLLSVHQLILNTEGAMEDKGNTEEGTGLTDLMVVNTAEEISVDHNTVAEISVDHNMEVSHHSVEVVRKNEKNDQKKVFVKNIF